MLKTVKSGLGSWYWLEKGETLWGNLGNQAGTVIMRNWNVGVDSDVFRHTRRWMRRYGRGAAGFGDAWNVHFTSCSLRACVSFWV